MKFQLPLNDLAHATKKTTTEKAMGNGCQCLHVCEDGLYNWAQPDIESVLLDPLSPFCKPRKPHVKRRPFRNASKVMSERLRFAQSEDEVGGSIQSMCIYVDFGIQLYTIIISIIIILIMYRVLFHSCLLCMYLCDLDVQFCET